MTWVPIMIIAAVLSFRCCRKDIHRNGSLIHVVIIIDSKTFTLTVLLLLLNTNFGIKNNLVNWLIVMNMTILIETLCRIMIIYNIIIFYITIICIVPSAVQPSSKRFDRRLLARIVYSKIHNNIIWVSIKVSCGMMVITNRYYHRRR